MNSIQPELPFLENYLLTFKKIIFNPILFFKTLPKEGSCTHPLAFALITHWIGAALSFLMRNFWGSFMKINLSEILKFSQKTFDLDDIDQVGHQALVQNFQDKLERWIWGMGSVLLDPFMTLVGIFFMSLLVYFGARILIPEHTRFESALKIVCYSIVPAVFAFLPGASILIFLVWIPVLVILGTREVYQITTNRAILISLFPNLLLLGIIFLVMIVLALGFMKLATSLLMY